MLLEIDWVVALGESPAGRTAVESLIADSGGTLIQIF